uniref:Transient receptor potential cation channel subfamily V member 3-like isoform X2 n=1 Tax=Phascolarctos cinereus TaxID=38626 RepID=A0A6P5IH27_PHACI|nr:transient receptor potential cation channel subfamily V member 3-like isoform X2 [Phascolarctos cinereus]
MVAEARRPRAWGLKRPEALGGLEPGLPHTHPLSFPPSMLALLSAIPQESIGLPQRTPWKTAGQVYLFLSAAMMLGKMGLDIIWMWPFQLLPFSSEKLFPHPWMILQDVVRFLLVYVVFLLGFASALSALTSQCLAPGRCPYHSMGSASGSLFKLTLGLGDLSGPEHSKFPVFFLLLLITYVILTSVLLLNMLIAIMTQTVNMAFSRNEKIWRVQRAVTILDLERCLPEAWRWWLQEGKIHSNLEVGLTPSQERDLRTCLRVNERRQARAAGRNQVMGISEDPTVPPDP